MKKPEINLDSGGIATQSGQISSSSEQHPDRPRTPKQIKKLTEAGGEERLVDILGKLAELSNEKKGTRKRRNCGDKCAAGHDKYSSDSDDSRTPRKKARQSSFSLPVTPKKNQSTNSNDCCIKDEPLTPTANLKMLVCAAFVASPAKEDELKIKKRELFGGDEDNSSAVSDTAIIEAAQSIGIEDERDVNTCSPPELDEQEARDSMKVNSVTGKNPCQANRKLKSLGLLCKKFLERYPEDMCGKEVYLDDVARELKVERRRVYDIVNVLESLEFMTKVVKNTYIWHGKKMLTPILKKLKALAMLIYKKDSNSTKWILSNPYDSDDCFEARWRRALNLPPVPSSSSSQTGNLTGGELPYLMRNSQDCDSHKSGSSESGIRRDKSLGILCQRFLMLFMIAENQMVALDTAAREVIEVGDEPLIGKNKTKVRRLYDIANILSSMGLVEKTSFHDGSFRRTAFKWTGVELDRLEPDREAIQNAYSAEFTKHSLLCCPLEETFKTDARRKLKARSMSANHIVTLKPSKPKFPRTNSAANISRKGSTASKKSTSEKFVTIDFAAVGLSQEQSPARSINPADLDILSPNERMFREEMQKLHDRFPEKLPKGDGLLQLLSACRKGNDNSLEANEIEKASRCCLLDRIQMNEAEVIVSEGDRPEQRLNSTVQNKSALDQQNCLADECVGQSEKGMLPDEPNFVGEDSCEAEVIKLTNGVPKGNVSSSEGDSVRTILSPWSPFPHKTAHTTGSEGTSKASIGIQASLLQGVSPIKQLHTVYGSHLNNGQGVPQTGNILANNYSINSPKINNSIVYRKACNFPPVLSHRNLIATQFPVDMGRHSGEKTETATYLSQGANSACNLNSAIARTNSVSILAHSHNSDISVASVFNGLPHLTNCLPGTEVKSAMNVVGTLADVCFTPSPINNTISIPESKFGGSEIAQANMERAETTFPLTPSPSPSPSDQVENKAPAVAPSMLQNLHVSNNSTIATDWQQKLFGSLTLPSNSLLEELRLPTVPISVENTKNVGVDRLIQMVQIPPTPLSRLPVKQRLESGNSVRIQTDVANQSNNTACTPRMPTARFLVPINLLPGETPKFGTPILLPRLSLVAQDETPTTFHNLSNANNVQRKLMNTPQTSS